MSVSVYTSRHGHDDQTSWTQSSMTYLAIVNKRSFVLFCLCNSLFVFLSALLRVFLLNVTMTQCSDILSGFLPGFLSIFLTAFLSACPSDSSTSCSCLCMSFIFPVFIYMYVCRVTSLYATFLLSCKDPVAANIVINSNFP